MRAARKAATSMMVFGFWLLSGVALGMILMAFLAIGMYQRGYNEGYFLRRPWRAELGARRKALVKAYAREMKATAPSRVYLAPTRAVAIPSPAAASSRGVVPSRVAASGG